MRILCCILYFVSWFQAQTVEEGWWTLTGRLETETDDMGCQTGGGTVGPEKGGRGGGGHCGR